MSLKENIKSKRLELDLTLEYVANQIGIAKPTLQRYESGVISNIPSDKIESLAKVFNISPSVLMGWEKEDNHSNTSAVLSKMEQDLLNKFNQLNDEAKNKVITYTNDLNEMTRYRKEDIVKKFPKKHAWEEPGAEYLMPIASHDDNLTSDEKENMNSIIDEFLAKKDK